MWDRLEEWMQQIGLAFNGPQCALKRLVLDIDFAHRWQKRLISEKLEIDTSKGVCVNIRMTAITSIVREVPRTRERLARLVEPLKGLRGLREVQITGVLSPEIASSIRDAMMESGKRGRDDDAETAESAKRTRLV